MPVGVLERNSSRRAFLGWLAASAACVVPSLGALAARPARAKERTRHPDDRPRYFVFICLDGGIDAIYTTAPKVKDEVAAGVDVPFAAGDIRTFGPNVVGPHLALLGDPVRDLCIINGVSTR